MQRRVNRLRQRLGIADKYVAVGTLRVGGDDKIWASKPLGILRCGKNSCNVVAKSWEDMNKQVTTAQQQSRLKELIAKGKEQGYLTYGEVNDHLPDDISDPEQIEDIIRMINDMGITVYETAPDTDDLLSTEENTADELAAEEAAAALAAVETEAGRTTDPVRMYMREMGTVELLTREGEIAIAKRIEEGLRDMLTALA